MSPSGDAPFWLLTARGSFQACSAAARDMGLDAQPSITGQTLHRFSGPAGRLDLMVPDHRPTRLTNQFTKSAPVAVPGGQRALDRRLTVDVATECGPASIPVPDLLGALVLNARTAVSTTRDRERHHSDLAQLSAIIGDSIDALGSLDKKEKKYLRRVQLAEDPTMSPWLEMSDSARQRAIDAWFTLTEG